MSMNVYAMNYINGLLKNQQDGTKSGSQNSDKAEMKQEELQQNVGSVQVTQNKYREDGTISLVQRMQGTEAYRQVKEGQGNFGESQVAADGQSYSGAVRMDTAVISEEGRRAYSKMSQQEEKVNERQDTVLKEVENKIENLSEYTDSELKQMYYRGEITLQEYEDETRKVIE